MSVGSHAQGAAQALALLAGLVIASMALSVLLAPSIAVSLASMLDRPVSYSHVVLRLMQVGSLLLTLLAVRWLAPTVWRSLGLRLGDGAGRRFAIGFGTGMLGVALVAALLSALDVRLANPTVSLELSYWVGVLIRSLIAALIISIIEEIWFRGALFTLLERAGGAVSAVVLTSVLYAVSHFIVRSDVPGGQDMGHALELIGASAARAVDPVNVDSLLALGIAGVWLSLARLRDRDIMMCLGIHTGWVVVIKVYKKYTYYNAESQYHWLVGGYDEVIGWSASAIFVLFVAATGWWFARTSWSPAR